MAADFDEESQLANETVTRQASNPNVTVALVVAAVVALVLVLVWNTSSRKGGKPQNAGEESFATARLQPGVSFDKPPPKPEENRFFIPPPPLAAPGAAAAAVVVPPPGVAVQQAPLDDSEARRLAELERLRKEEEAKREARLRSPMLVVNDREGTASVDGSAHVTAEEKEEDANRKFLRNAENDVVRARATKNHRTDALVPQGFMIRGILETAISSDLPGNVRATTTEDVYSFDGRRVLIPKGTMLTGEYRSGLNRGQSRIFIVWTRMLRADGVSLMLGSVRDRQFGALRPDRRSGQAFPRQIRQCGAADDHGGRGAIRRAAWTKQSKPSEQSELCLRSDDRDADTDRGWKLAKSDRAQRAQHWRANDVAEHPKNGRGSSEGRDSHSADDLRRSGDQDHRFREARSRLLRSLPGSCERGAV